MPDYVLEFLVQLLQPVLLALGAWLAAEAIRWVRSHVSHEQSRDALERLVAVVSTSVGETQQVYVAGLKAAAADGKLTAEEQSKALATAVTKARELLGPKGIGAIQTVIGTDQQALDKWLIALVEAQISKSKPTALAVGEIACTSPEDAAAKAAEIVRTAIANANKESK